MEGIKLAGHVERREQPSNQNPGDESRRGWPTEGEVHPLNQEKPIMNEGITRAERLHEIEWHYIQRAYSDLELAKKLGVNRSTIFRDRTILSTRYYLYEESRGRYRIEKSSYLSLVTLNLHEALALYLAARRASRRTLSAQPNLSSGLLKLAKALRKPMTERLVVSANAIAGQEEHPEWVQALETVTKGWVEGQAVRIVYRSMRADQAAEYTLHPYLIEPGTTGDGEYVIGWCDVHDEIRTFKIERIERAYLLLERFEIPPDFDEAELLRYAWGIWLSDEPPEVVRLRFAPGKSSRRVKESVWRPTQRITELEDGGCIWEAQVSGWREMQQWVLGWGGDCEALEPEGLRDAVREEARRMMERYES
jgi:predicted DNA-binding transcriptional regulator YafY